MACLSPFRYNGIVRKGGMVRSVFLLLLMLKDAGCLATVGICSAGNEIRLKKKGI